MNWKLCRLSLLGLDEGDGANLLVSRRHSNAPVAALADQRASTKPSDYVPGAEPRLLDAGVDLTCALGNVAPDRVGEAVRGVHVHDDGAVAFEADLDARLLEPIRKRLELEGLGTG